MYTVSRPTAFCSLSRLEEVSCVKGALDWSPLRAWTQHILLGKGRVLACLGWAGDIFGLCEHRDPSVLSPPPLKPTLPDPFTRLRQPLLRCCHGHPNVAFTRVAEAVPRRRDNTR